MICIFCAIHLNYWELKQQCFLYIPAYLPFSVVKITENIHGIDLLINEGFDFVKSRTEKKTFQGSYS